MNLLCLSLLLMIPFGNDTQELKLLKTWRCDDCDGPEMLAEPLAIAVNDLGEICISDNREPMLRLFSLTEPSKSFGVKGEGPDEFQLPGSINFTKKQTIFVMDQTRSLLRSFDRNHKLLTSLKVPGTSMACSYSPSSEQLFFSIIDFAKMTSVFYRAKGQELEQLSVNLDILTEKKNKMFFAFAAHPRGGFLLGEGEHYKIHHFREDGSFIKTIERKVPIAFKAPERIEAERESRAQAQAKMGISRKVSIKESYYPFYMGGLAANEANLWVLTGPSRDQPAVFDLFDLDGAFLKQVKLSVPLQSFAVSNNYLAGISLDEEGDYKIHLWSLK